MIRATSIHSRVLLLALASLFLAGSLPGCATRTVRHELINRQQVQVDLVREVAGFTVEKRGYEHPAIISEERLAHILGAIEVETVASGEGTIRQPAFAAEVVPETAEVLSEALRQASPDEEVGVKVIRRESRLGLFNKKFLTTFIAYVKDGYLYVLLRHVDFPIKESEEKKPWPDPKRDRTAMGFRVVTGEPIYFAGLQDLEIDWRSDVFRTAFKLPGSTGGEKRRREVIDSSPIPKEEIRSADLESIGLADLTPEQLRALADLEEDRREGRITENTYQRARRQLLRKR